MDAYKIVTDAEWKLDHNEISLGEYNDMIEPCRDVEAVVRCGECVKANTKDCSHSYWDDDWGVWRIGYKDDDWFCADGERKESE